MELRELIEEMFMEKAAVNEVCHSIAAEETSKKELLTRLELNAQKLLESNFDMLTELTIRQIDGGDIDDISASNLTESGELAYETDDDDSDILEQMMALDQE